MTDPYTQANPPVSDAPAPQDQAPAAPAPAVGQIVAYDTGERAGHAVVAEAFDVQDAGDGKPASLLRLVPLNEATLVVRADQAQRL